MAPSVSLANRLGFAILGLTNNFGFVIMLSAAYDLLKQSEVQRTSSNYDDVKRNHLDGNSTIHTNNKSYCNEHSTSTILLADTLPSLVIKFSYPLLLVSIPASYKALGTALLAAAGFLITGLADSQVFIFTGVICAALSAGLGESTFLSNTPIYGDVSLSGWSMGTGAAGLFGAIAYALLRMILSVKLIMLVMLVVPVAMLFAFFKMIEPVVDPKTGKPIGDDKVGGNLTIIGNGEDEQVTVAAFSGNLSNKFNFREKMQFLPTLAKYFLPLLLVYFAEYFINQGLFELIHYPEVNYLDHAAQYRWFQVSYQLGVMISRSTLDFFQLKNIWAMSLLQFANALLFLAHAAKLIYLPSFYLVVILIIYEGLLGGFTYVNAFHRIKKETPPGTEEFSISTVTTADTLGIAIAGFAAIPTHNALCKLYV